MKEQSNKIIWWITLALLAVSILVIYVTHRTVPFMMDDLWYSTKLSSDVPISTLGDIMESQIWHWYHWGGRSMAHGLLQMILLSGEQVADVLNLVFTLLLSGMICMVAGDKRLFTFFSAIGMLHGLNANWKMSMYWQAGAANYLYMMVFILLFLYCYLREDIERQLPGISIWMIPLGFIVGWSNENMGPSVWVISLVVIVLYFQKEGNLKLWMILGNISCLLGSIMLIAAPGNFVRSAQVASNEYGFLWNCFLRGYAESKAALEYLFPAILCLVFLIFITKGILKIPFGRRNLLLLLGALLSWGAMVLSPHYPDRAAFGSIVLLICVILSLIKEICDRREELSWMLWGVSLLIWLRGMFFIGEFLAIQWGWIR